MATRKRQTIKTDMDVNSEVIQETSVETENFVEEIKEPEELDLSKQVTVRSIADWLTGFTRRTDFGGDVSISKNGVIRLTRNEIIAQVQNGNRLFIGEDGRGSHATLYIEDEPTRKEVGFINQKMVNEDLVKELFSIRNQSEFESRVVNDIYTRAEKYKFMVLIADLKMNDYSKISFAEKHTGYKLEKIKEENNF